MSDIESLPVGTETCLVEASRIHKNGLVILHDRPCRVTSVYTWKIGKHGEPKCRFSLRDVFTNEQYKDVVAKASRRMTVPVVSRQQYTLLGISDDLFALLMDASGATRDDLPLPTFHAGFVQDIRDDFAAGKELVLTVLKVGRFEQIVSKDDADDASAA